MDPPLNDKYFENLVLSVEPEDLLLPTKNDTNLDLIVLSILFFLFQWIKFTVNFFHTESNFDQLRVRIDNCEVS